MDGHQAHQMDEHLADHRNAIEFDLVEEFEPIQLKTPSPKPQLTIDLPLRLPLKEDEEVHVNTQFHQLNQSDTQSERIIEIIERIFLDADVVASPSSSQQPEEMPWSRSDSDVDLGKCHPLESSTLKRVAKGPTSQKLEDSGVCWRFTAWHSQYRLSMLIPMENEHKEVEIQPVIFTIRALIQCFRADGFGSSISVENRLDDHPSSSNHSDDQIADHPPKQLESPIVNQIEKPNSTEI
uniref:Uncharacterized protein n=1 Tax=Ditylenchus dipsaci TaxID=166011 RepID=A0A915DAN3_9BILA